MYSNWGEKYYKKDLETKAKEVKIRNAVLILNSAGD